MTSNNNPKTHAQLQRVVWKGDSLIDGVPETLNLLRSKLVFVTNNSTKSRRQYAKKFHSLGILVSEIYVIGEEGILEELQLAGFTGLGGPEDGEKTARFKPNCMFEHDKSVGAVVVGLDQRINYYNYYKLQYESLTSCGFDITCVTTLPNVHDPSNKIQPDYYTIKV
ncbi:hypothetical protein UlMin_018068 [Ulmus minor]